MLRKFGFYSIRLETYINMTVFHLVWQSHLRLYSRILWNAFRHQIEYITYRGMASSQVLRHIPNRLTFRPLGFEPNPFSDRITLKFRGTPVCMRLQRCKIICLNLSRITEWKSWNKISSERIPSNFVWDWTFCRFKKSYYLNGWSYWWFG